MAKVAGGSSEAKRRSRSRMARFGERKSTGTKRTASAGGGSRSSASSTDPTFVVCVDPRGNDDLLVRRIYQVLPDESAASSGFVRVIDDSGGDYLYPAYCFVAVDLPKALRDALQAVA